MEVSSRSLGRASAMTIHSWDPPCKVLWVSFSACQGILSLCRHENVSDVYTLSMRLTWDAPSSWPAALSEPQPHRCWAEAGESEARLWDWQMGTVFTPGSLAPLLLFLSQRQLCVKTPSDCITAFRHNACFLSSDLTKDVIPCRATLKKLPQFGHLP